LVLTPQDAEIIEVSLRGDKCDVSRYRWFLKSIGDLLTGEQEREIELDFTDEELWFLRDNIDPAISVGELTGLDIIKKIYNLLLSDKLMDNYEVAEEGKHPLEVIKCQQKQLLRLDQEQPQP